MSDSPTLARLDDFVTRVGTQRLMTVADLLNVLSSLSVEEREAAGIREVDYCEQHGEFHDPDSGVCRMVLVLIWPKEAR